MMRIVCAISLLAVLAGGCSKAYYIRSADSDEFRAFDDRSARERCVVVLDDGAKQPASNVRLAEDTTCWCDPETDEEIRVPTQRVQRIVFVDQGLGFIQGIGLGLALAGGVGAILGWSEGEDDCGNSSDLVCFSRGEWSALLGIAFGIPGAVVGGAVGLAAGAKCVYYPFPRESIDESDEFDGGIHVDDRAVRQ